MATGKWIDREWYRAHVGVLHQVLRGGGRVAVVSPRIDWEASTDDGPAVIGWACQKFACEAHYREGFGSYRIAASRVAMLGDAREWVAA